MMEDIDCPNTANRAFLQFYIECPIFKDIDLHLLWPVVLLLEAIDYLKFCTNVQT